jgi:hypothetical protein
MVVGRRISKTTTEKFISVRKKNKRIVENYYEHILTFPTDGISRKLFCCYPKGRKERRRPLKRMKGPVPLTLGFEGAKTPNIC